MEDRYSIRLDENGQPYLAHALFNSGRQGQGIRQNHKYILKIGQGEQARYFYTPEEVRAYYNELKKKASEKVEDVKKSVQNTVKNVKSKTEQMREEFRKKDQQKQEKAVAEPVRSKGPAGMEKKPAEAEEKTEKKGWENNRPEGRKRNVTGTAEKIEKGKSAAQAELDAIDAKIEPLQKKAENARNEYLRARDKYGDDSKEAQAYRDDYLKTQKELSALEEQRRDRKDRDTWAHEQNSVDPKGQNTHNALSFRKTKPSEYKANDSDFDEKNYSEKNHVKDTDFYTFKRSDGRWVILEEDMKWVLPEGVSGDNPKVRKALRGYADEESSKASMKKDSYTYDDWVNAVSEAIDEAAEGVREEEKKKSK